MLPPPTVAEARALILEHLDDHYAFYGEETGVRIARKHLGWYTRDLAGGAQARSEFNAAETTRDADRGRAPLLRPARRTGRPAGLRACGEGVVHAASALRRRRQTTGGNAVGRGGPRRVKRNIASERQQRDRPQRRALARRVFPQARRRVAVRRLRHGDRPRRARDARVASWSARTATRRRPPTCSA